MKKISVIVNCFNGEKYLYKCLKSILDQKYQNFEIIFFDNFSTDKSINIAKKIIDKRIKLFSSKKKLKLYEARNEAINNASGELIAFLMFKICSPLGSVKVVAMAGLDPDPPGV